MNASKGPSLWLIVTLFILTAGSGLRAEAPATFTVGEFTFTRPANWEWVDLPSSSMRKAQLKVKDAEGKASGEVVFFQFSSNAGSVKANVERWLGQFEEPREKINAKVEETTVGKTRVTYVQAEGTYKSGMPGGPTTPMAGFALLGAILESGEENVFVKMTGPQALVKASVQEFKKMVESGPKKN
jgi:hypothetical protein